MRQLIGKFPGKGRNIVEEVYFTEQIRCVECQKAVPMGIEVIIVQKEGTSKKVIKHAYYCRAHGSEYVARTQG